MSVAVGLIPEVEVDVGGPQDQEGAESECHMGRRCDGSRGVARPLLEKVERAILARLSRDVAVRRDIVTTAPFLV